MREYQRKKGKYILPRTVYLRTIWTIRDYHRMSDDKIEYEECRAIETARDCIPEEYRQAVWDNIMYGKPYPQIAERSTYGHYKSKFVCKAAELLRIYQLDTPGKIADDIITAEASASEDNF